VVNNDSKQRPPHSWEQTTSQILVSRQWAPALRGIEEFSHLIILFWLDRITESVTLHVRPQRRDDAPLVGLSACRTPVCPNPVGLWVVELVSCKDNMLMVRGLDAFNRSPVLDIKPYLPRGDCVTNARVPAWVRRLWGESEEKHPV
jgi:tRNA-Thr(GGU) m(6)t(6)A37 methyltransferase TsaA